jgi:hypothetical protein
LKAETNYSITSALSFSYRQINQYYLQLTEKRRLN